MQKPNTLYRTQGNGKPFVFLHGLGASINQVVKLIEGIKGIKLITTDAPGHGLSPFPEEDPSFELYADEVINLMDHLGIERAILGGISMGAGISMNIASRFPERVESLIIVRPAWLDKPVPENLKILMTAAEYLTKEAGKDKFQRLEVFHQMKMKLPSAAMSVYGLFAADQQSQLHKVLWHMVSDQPNFDYKIINEHQIPCCVIANNDDPLHPIKMAKEIHANLANSQFHKVTSRYKNDQSHKKQVQKIISQFIST